MTRQESQQCVCRWWVLLFAPSLYILQTCRQGDKQAKRLGSYSDLTHCPEKLLLFLRIHFPEQYLDFWLYFYVPLLAFSVIFFFGWLAWVFFPIFESPYMSMVWQLPGWRAGFKGTIWWRGEKNRDFFKIICSWCSDAKSSIGASTKWGAGDFRNVWDDK